MSDAPSPARLAVYGVLLFVSATALGFGASGIVDQLRVITINSVFGNWESGTPVWARGIAIPVGILACIAAAAKYGRAILRPMLSTASLVLSGLAVGVGSAAAMWAPADRVGVAYDPTFGEHQPWGIVEWIFYAAQWWLPAAFVGVAAVSVISSIRVWSRRRRGEPRRR